MKVYFIVTAICLMIALLLGCKKNSEPDAGGPCTQDNLKAKATAYTTASQTYGTTPTIANCQAVVVAYDNYLAAAQNCSFVTQAQIKAVQDARAALANACK